MRETVSLLCLPCAGASATMYLRWRRRLPEWVSLVPVELPGRGTRLAEPLMRDFDTLIARLYAEQQARMTGPFALFGHSMGGLLAYGLAQRLQVLRQPLPVALFASGSPAPGHRDVDRFAQLHGDAALTEDLRKQGGTPREVFESPDLMRITLDTLDADYRVCESFDDREPPPLTMQVHAFGGRDDDIEQTRIQAWSRIAAAGCTVDWFEGGHFFIRQDEDAVLAALVDRLSACAPARGDADATRSAGGASAA